MVLLGSIVLISHGPAQRHADRPAILGAFKIAADFQTVCLTEPLQPLSYRFMPIGIPIEDEPGFGECRHRPHCTLFDAVNHK
jgi:hypothetical protein